jgi:ComF family protein
MCALPITRAVVCGACLDRPPHFDRVSAAFAYGFPVDALVHALKYGGNLAVARILGEALGRAVASEHVDLIVPMPLSVQRLRERGFNQAHEIARSVGRATRTPVAFDLCRRVIDTAAQAALPWKERARNVRGAFVCDGDLGEHSVAIVDDVMTTGATLDELAKNLKRAGAREVRGWIVARALKQDQDSAPRIK